MLRLVDLRQAALQEYPEFGVVPWPAPWWQRAWYNSLVILLAFTAEACVVLALVMH
jgi:hypothetical protein